MNYFLGGYYLVRPRPIDFGSEKDNFVMTCSNCINDSLLDSWSYGWSEDNSEITNLAKSNFSITDEDLSRIRLWVDQKYEEKRLGWVGIFADLEAAKEYKELFFAHLPGLRIMSVYLDENEAGELIKEFDPKEKEIGLIGLCQNLKKGISEHDAGPEKMLGFDFIGVDIDGSFHSYYCHDIGKELIGKFGLTLNQYGLFEQVDNWQPVLDYLNDEDTALAPVPWYVAKTKLVQLAV